jgi:hydroxymethylpyrimidine pyrophosphatase-like HAD family hydrolase
MTYVVDIDDTLLFSRLEADGSYTLLSKNVKLIDVLNDLKKKDNNIILYTGRHWNHLNVTIEQLKDAGVNYDTLVMGKPVGDYYIDDKAWRPEQFASSFH